MGNAYKQLVNSYKWAYSVLKIGKDKNKRSYYNENGGGQVQFFIPFEYGRERVVKFEDEGTVEYVFSMIYGQESDGRHVMYVKVDRLPRFTLPRFGEWKKYQLVII